MPVRGWKTLLLVAALITAVIGVAVFYPASFAANPSARLGTAGHAGGTGTVASASFRGGLVSESATLTAPSAVLVGAGDSLKVLSTSGNGADYSSREGTHKPQLVLTVR